MFVTHDRDEALRLGERVAVIVDGRLRQVGATTEVFAAPADEKVAALVGAETIVPGKRLPGEPGLVRVQVGPHVIEAVAEGALPEDVLVVLAAGRRDAERAGRDAFGQQRAQPVARHDPRITCSGIRRG